MWLSWLTLPLPYTAWQHSQIKIQWSVIERVDHYILKEYETSEPAIIVQEGKFFSAASLSLHFCTLTTSEGFSCFLQ